MGVHGPLTTLVEAPARKAQTRGSAPWWGYCHDPFPELSPHYTPALHHLQIHTPATLLRTPPTTWIRPDQTQLYPLGCTPLHRVVQTEPWSEGIPTALGDMATSQDHMVIM